MLSFISRKIILVGIHLKELFYEFMSHLPRIVGCLEARYSALTEKAPMINSIAITEGT